MTTISKVQPMRPAEIELVDQVNINTGAIETNRKNLAQEVTDRTNADTEINAKFPVSNDNIADGAVTTVKIADMQITNAKLASDSVSTDRIIDKAVTTAKLEQDVQDKLILVESFPTLTYGKSEATTVQANSNVLVDITFPSAFTEAPNVYCMVRSTVCVECNVEQVTNQQVSIRLYNNTTSNAESVSIDWLAISGR